MLHQEAADERTGSTQPGFAVHRDSALGLLADGQKLLHDVVVRRSAVGKEEVEMGDAGANEDRGVVQLVVESYDGGDVVAPEVGQIGFRRVQLVAVDNPAVDVRRRKGEQFLRHDPIHVTVLHLRTHNTLGERR